MTKTHQNQLGKVARHFNLPNHSNEHMSICDLSPLINQIFVYHSPTDTAPQFLQKLIVLLGKDMHVVSAAKFSISPKNVLSVCCFSKAFHRKIEIICSDVTLRLNIYF